MESIRIVGGGHRLEGEIPIHGAKNSALPLLAATLLVAGECSMHNCPRLSDVTASTEILRHLGCRVTRQDHVVTVDATAPTRRDIPDRLMGEMRSSIVFLGAMVARLGAAELTYPGGCELGPRPIDLHLSALRQLGCRWRSATGVCIAPPTVCTGRTSPWAFPVWVLPKTCCWRPVLPMAPPTCATLPESRRLPISANSSIPAEPVFLAMKAVT